MLKLRKIMSILLVLSVLLGTLTFSSGAVSFEDWATKVPTDLPILLISGEDDPVGGYGKGVCAVAGALTGAGARRLTTVLIPGARHEVLNETDRAQTYELIDGWLDGIIAEDKR
mgnify:CR=1 FL=1